VAASDIGHPGASFQFRLDAFERRNPVRNQIGVVARPEEAFGAGEKTLRMLVPANAFPGSKRFGDLGFVEIGGLHDIERTGKESRRPLFGERHGLLGESENAFFSG
jgi:hypothetical protein